MPRDMSDKNRCLAVICNPGSGTMRADPNKLDVLRQALGEGDELYLLRSGSDPVLTAERAVAEGASTLVACGGDGTICAVATVAIRHGLPLAVIPGGTFNYFARGLGLSEDLEAAIEVARKGPVRAVDVGQVGDRIFLNNASLGVYPAILKERETVYARWGRYRVMAYWSVLTTFFRFQRPLRLVVGTEEGDAEFRTPLLFAAQSVYQLSRFDLDGGDCIEAGNLAVFVAKKKDRWSMIRSAFRLVRHRMMPGEDFDLICAQEISVSSPNRARRLRVAFDGEKTVMTLPIRFRVLRGALKAICPA